MENAIKGFALLLTLASLFGGFVFAAMMVSAKSAPQEAAGSAMALCLVVIPYVFVRSLQMMKGGSGAG